MDKTVLITGASRGIGKATALLFSSNNYNVIINYNKSEKEAKDLELEINQKRMSSALAIKADISSFKEVDEMVKLAIKRFGKIDVLINNAGISQFKLFIDNDEKDFETMINTNVKGVFNTCSSTIPNMLSRKYGKIVNISSIWGVVGGSCESLYSMSKAAIIGLSKALSKELGPSNINVNCIAPGFVQTDMTKDIENEIKKEIQENTSLERLGTVSDIANLALFLASDNASFITGQVINSTGGWII